MPSRSLLRELSLTPTLLVAVMASFSAYAQDEAGSRDVKLAQPNSRTLTINQIETSKYPKVDIFALVTENDQPVTGLLAKDFRVREDEIDQEPIAVEAQVVPLNVIVTVDTSGSMSKAMPKTREAAASFVDSLGAQDTVGVVSFSRSVQVLTPLGSTKDSAKQTISALQARGDTALYDALYASLEAAKTRTGRRAVVLLGDGVDDDGQGKQLSKRSLQEVIALAKEINVPIFTIGLGTEMDEKVLKEAATASGGQYFSAPTAEELQVLYGKLGKQLSGQYHISYSSNLPADGTVHNIQLQSDQLRGAKAYTAPQGSTSQVGRIAEPTPVPVATVTSDSGASSFVGGAGPESAPLLPIGRAVTVKNPGTNGKFYVAVQLTGGVLATGQALISPSNNDWCYMRWITPELKELEQKQVYGENGQMQVRTATRKENAGKWYIAFTGPVRTVSLGIYASQFTDAGSGDDAGESEAKALTLPESSTITGYVQYNWDDIDGYKATLKGGREYQFRARPDLGGKIMLRVYDEDGNQVAKGSSQNAGAGTTVSFTPKSDMRAVLSVVADSSGDYDMHSYSLVFGEKGVSAPEQPSEPVITSVLTK